MESRGSGYADETKDANVSVRLLGANSFYRHCGVEPVVKFSRLTEKLNPCLTKLEVCIEHLDVPLPFQDARGLFILWRKQRTTGAARGSLQLHKDYLKLLLGQRLVDGR